MKIMMGPEGKGLNIKQLATGRDENGTETFRIFCGKGNREEIRKQKLIVKREQKRIFFNVDTEM